MAKERFLEKVAKALLANTGEPLHSKTVVLPNRRAGVFLLDALRNLSNRPVIAPEVRTWSEFLRAHSTLQVPDTLTQVLAAYSAWQVPYPDETFEEFYSWGEILVQDFDEVDRQLLDPDQLFQNLADLDAVDETFQLDLQDYPRFRAFWESLSGATSLAISDHFLTVWQALRGIYHTYHTHLESRGHTTEGRIVREIVARLATESVSFPSAASHVFVGTHALTKGELQLLKAYQRQGAAIWIDGDHWYTTESTHHQAGHSLRELLADFSIADQLSDDYHTQARTVTAIATPGAVAQTLVAGELLQELTHEAAQAERIAVVLPDETLLPLVLQRLPDGLPVNVTMGFPLKQTQVFTWIYSLTELWLHARLGATGAVTTFHTADLTRWLGQGLSDRLLQEKALEMRQQLRQSSWAHIPVAELPHLPANLTQLARQESPIHFQPFVAQLQALLRDLSAAGEQPLSSMEQEAAVQVLQSAQQLANQLEQEALALDMPGFLRLLRTFLATIRIPFLGEPLAGVQIMGFLETRLLDFDRIILLSVNEETLPPKPSGISFIPFGLRKAYGLPTVQETQAVNAYHFYRLLQRADHTYLLHSVGAGKDAQTPSRYLLQLELEAAPETKTTFHQESRSVPFSVSFSPDISIRPDEDVSHRLGRYLIDGENRGALSPTSITEYLKCPLKFYFRYVAGLQEPDELSEDLDAGQFGSLLHRTLQLLFLPFVGKTVTAEDIRGLQPTVKAALAQAQQELPSGIDLQHGENLLHLLAIEQLVVKQLDADQERAPFTLLGVELPLQGSLTLPDGRSVALKGTLDRIEQQGDTVWILDYKTGNVELKSTVKDDFLTNLFSKPDKHPELQTLLYGLLYLQQLSANGAPYPTSLKTGILSFRKHTAGIQASSYDLVDPVQREAFEQYLQETLARLFDGSTPFTQEKNDSNCGYCPYYRLCYYS